MGDKVFASVPMQGTGIYRPTRCRANRGKWNIPHRDGRKPAAKLKGNKLPRSCLSTLKTAALPSRLTAPAALPSAPAQHTPSALVPQSQGEEPAGKNQ